MIALFGPTGVGKTGVAIALAELLRGRGEDPLAVSADALQVYRGLELLTGAAGAAEQERLEHRLLSFVSPRESFSAGLYAPRAHEEIDAALAAGRRPLVVGGTGLYLQAALTDLELRPPPDPSVREEIEARVNRHGAPALHAELARRAPAAAARIDPRDRTRVVRALELVEMGEEPAPVGSDSRLWTARMRHPTLLCRPRDGAHGPLPAHRRTGGRDRRRGRARSGAWRPTPPAPRAPRGPRSASRSS